MKVKKPLESVGWLSGNGYQMVVDEAARQIAKSMSAKATRDSSKNTTEEKKSKARAAAAKC